jgi:alcohol dehydrogenase class IV
MHNSRETVESGRTNLDEEVVIRMKKSNLAKPQTEYKEAKERFEKANEAFQNKLATVKLLGVATQEKMEELIEETGLHTALNDLGEAEKALLHWSHEAIQNEKDYLQNKETIDKMYAFINQDPDIKAKLIQAAMKIV